MVHHYGVMPGGPAHRAHLEVLRQHALQMPVQRHAHDVVPPPVGANERDAIISRRPMHRGGLGHLDVSHLSRRAGHGVVQPQAHLRIACQHRPRKGEVAARGRPHRLQHMGMGADKARGLVPTGTAGPQLGHVGKAPAAGAHVGNAPAVRRNVVGQHIEGTVGQLRDRTAARVHPEQVNFARKQVSHAVGLVGELPRHLRSSGGARAHRLAGAGAAQVRVHGHGCGHHQRLAVGRPAQAGHPARQLTHGLRLAGVLHVHPIKPWRAVAVRDEGQRAAIRGPARRPVVARTLGDLRGGRTVQRKHPQLGLVGVVLPVHRPHRANSLLQHQRAMQLRDEVLQVQIVHLKRLAQGLGGGGMGGSGHHGSGR